MPIVKQRILVTGATGFVGLPLIFELLDKEVNVSALVRNKNANLPGNIKQIILPDIATENDWSPILKGIEAVIHVAGRAHIVNDIANPLAAFREVNTRATIQLAKQAAKEGVNRFIFISSIKVNGESTEAGKSFSPNDGFVPEDPYGLSKYEAEQGLLALAAETGMEVVIIRPPLVYGPGVKANFASMLKWINKGVPLPFGTVHNQRSLVALDNLIDFIIHCIDHPKAANELFLISDGEDVSTTELLRKVANAFGKKPMLLPIPVWLMTSVAKLVGKGDVASRLLGSLQVDSSKARELLGWKPVITMDEQLKKTADAFLEHEKTL